jgi:tetratricopeptide (TPR) repeat protein
MAVEIILTTVDGAVTATHAGRPLAAATALADLPRITADANPYRMAPVELGQRLFAALGGPALTDLLDADDARLLYLVTDEAAAGVPWEYAAGLDGSFLACDYGFLRLLPDARPARPVAAAPAPLNFIALAADPLVQNDADRTPRTGYKLDVENELQAIGRVLRGSGISLTAQRLPPTADHLRAALRRGPAILHLSCHGEVIETSAGGRNSRQAALLLEDQDGMAAPLRGPTFTAMPAPGVLRLVVLSACRTAASAMDASLARSLVLAGVPAAIGMQGDFPDPLSDDLAAALYDCLLAGHGLGEALRQARLAMADRPYAVGLPVAYVAAGGDAPLPRQPGQPAVADLRAGRYANVPLNLQPPRPFVGREAELHELACAFDSGVRVVTVVGAGGIGKTALAAAFAARFGWLFDGGVIGFSLADLPGLAPESLFLALLERVAGAQVAASLADRPAERIAEAFAAATRERPPLVLLDNYESVLQHLKKEPDGGEAAPAADAPPAAPETLTALRDLLVRHFNLEELRTLCADVGVDYDNLGGEGKEARARELVKYLNRRGRLPQLIRAGAAARPDAPWDAAGIRAAAAADAPANAARLHRLAASLARGGLPLLLTSRQQPAGLDGERVFPRGGALDGVTLAAGATLFFHHSSRAKAAPEAHAELALEIARATDGHPLAISLLAGEFDVSREVAPAAFLADWDRELAAARRPGLAEHHVTFATAFDRSYRLLSTADQARLVALSRFRLPFFAEAAAFLWEGAAPDAGAEEALAATRASLDSFVRRSLLRVDATFTGTDQAATYRLEPVIQRQLAAGLSPEGQEALASRYAAYSGWLVNQAFGKTGSDPGMASLIQAWADELMGQFESQEKSVKANYCWKLAEALTSFGRLTDATKLLSVGEGIPEILPADLNHVRYAQANIAITHGNLERALTLYTNIAAALEQVGDRQGKAATLHQMAQVYLTRGDLDQAMRLYQQSLALDEQVGDLKGKAATLHQMAQVYLTRGDLDQAMRLYQQSLALKEQVGDLQGKAATLHQMAQVYLTRGDLDQAMRLYQQSLALKEQVGDLKGKAATLHNMAQVYLTRGDLDQAMRLYQQSLALKEQVGDLQGKAATLSQMSNVHWGRGELDEAARLVEESLDIARQIGDQQGEGFRSWKLGQIAQTRGDREAAAQRYREGLAIFERMGMPEANQVREMLASLDEEHQQRAATPEQAVVALTHAAARQDVRPADVAAAAVQAAAAAEMTPDCAAYLAALAAALRDPGDGTLAALAAAADALLAGLSEDMPPDFAIALRQGLARFFARHGQPAAAVAWQEPVIAALRARGEERAAQEQLNVLLYNQAGYLANAGRLEDAVAALEEAVAIDRRFGLPDLASDTAALAGMIRRRDGLPVEEDEATGIPPDALPPEAQAQLQEAVQQLARLSPEEQQAAQMAVRRELLAAQANEIAEAALAARREGRVAELLPQLAETAAYLADGEAADSPYAQLAGFVSAVSALLRGDSPPAVPQAYVERFAALRQGLG